MKNLLIKIVIILLLLTQIYFHDVFRHYISIGFKTEVISNITVFDPNTWIFNQKVAQYSTKIIRTKDNKLYVEALTLFSYINEDHELIKEKIKCIVYIDHRISAVLDINETIKRPTFTTNYKTFRSIWKVRCQLSPINQYLLNLNRIRVAITDIQEYKELNSSGIYTNKENLLSFHWVNFYDERIAKKKAVAHCVHMVYELKNRKLNQLKNWLKIQKSIGIDRIKFYFASVEDSIKTELKQEFGNYIDIIDYKLDFDVICKYPLLLNLTSKVDNITIKYLYENCVDFYYRYFDGSKFYMFNANEVLCTNDCLLGFKYQYEFTTNYDIDEVIFPRKFFSNDYSYFKSVSTCNQSLNTFDFNYSIYDYAVNLTRKYGSNIGYFHFENVNFLSLPEVSNQAKSFLNNNTIATQLVLRDNAGIVHLNIDPTHNRTIREMKEMNSLLDCYNGTIFNGNKLDSIWNVPYAVLLNHRLGKSIFNTNLTLFYNQHNADYLESDARNVTLSIDEGYSVHIRSHFYNLFIRQRYSFSHFRLDIEFYQFIAYLNTF